MSPNELIAEFEVWYAENNELPRMDAFFEFCEVKGIDLYPISPPNLEETAGCVQLTVTFHVEFAQQTGDNENE